MATPTTTKIDIPLILGRLAPTAEYHWRGDGYGVYADIGEWRSPGIAQPTEAAVYAEWDVYLAEKAQTEAKITKGELKVAEARITAAAIPNWASWDKATALGWFDARLSNVQIDAVGNLNDAKAILKDMATVNRALVRMVLAMRDHTWPDLTA